MNQKYVTNSEGLEVIKRTKQIKMILCFNDNTSETL